MLKWIKRLGWFIVLLLIALGIFLLTPMGRDAARIATLSPELRTATITDTQMFTPQLVVGANCIAAELPAATQPDPALAKALDDAKAYSDKADGVGLIIMREGQVLHESYRDGGSPDQAARSNSMHKSVVALVFGIAVEEGAIGSVDDPVDQYIEEWAGEPRGKITLRQLLNMESGVELTSIASFSGLRLLLGNDINAVALDKELSHAPGSKFEYNNANSQILGIALDRALKKAGHSGYAAYLEEKLWCPLGNGKAALWYDAEPADGGTPRYYAGIFSNLRNWARIGELIRNDGQAGEVRLISSEWLSAMREPAPKNPNYGLHVWLDSPEDGQRRYSESSSVTIPHSAPYLADDVVFFDGFGGQRVYVIPSAGVTIARYGQVNLDYDDAIIVNLILAGLTYR